MSESKSLQDLVRGGFTPTRAMEIYNQFVYDYKNKHIGKLDVRNHNEWYDRRAEVFKRYVSIHYLGERK